MFSEDLRKMSTMRTNQHQRLQQLDDSPARLGDDHLGADLVEPFPQLGALQLHQGTSVPVRRQLVLLAAGLSVFGPRPDSASLRLTGRVSRPPRRRTFLLHFPERDSVQTCVAGEHRGAE